VGGTVITYYKFKDQKRATIGLTRPEWGYLIHCGAMRNVRPGAQSGPGGQDGETSDEAVECLPATSVGGIGLGPVHAQDDLQSY